MVFQSTFIRGLSHGLPCERCQQSCELVREYRVGDVRYVALTPRPRDTLSWFPCPTISSHGQHHVASQWSIFDSHPLRPGVSAPTTGVLPLRLARALAIGAAVAVPVNVDPPQALGAPPPGRRDASGFERLFVDAAPSLLDVLLVELPQVVSEMV